MKIKLQWDPTLVGSETYKLKMILFDSVSPGQLLLFYKNFVKSIVGTRIKTDDTQVSFVQTFTHEEIIKINSLENILDENETNKIKYFITGLSQYSFPKNDLIKKNRKSGVQG